MGLKLIKQILKLNKVSGSMWWFLCLFSHCGWFLLSEAVTEAPCIPGSVPHDCDFRSLQNRYCKANFTILAEVESKDQEKDKIVYTVKVKNKAFGVNLPPWYQVLPPTNTNTVKTKVTVFGDVITTTGEADDIEIPEVFQNEGRHRKADGLNPKLLKADGLNPKLSKYLKKQFGPNKELKKHTPINYSHKKKVTRPQNNHPGNNKPSQNNHPGNNKPPQNNNSGNNKPSQNNNSGNNKPPQNNNSGNNKPPQNNNSGNNKLQRRHKRSVDDVSTEKVYTSSGDCGYTELLIGKTYILAGALVRESENYIMELRRCESVVEQVTKSNSFSDTLKSNFQLGFRDNCACTEKLCQYDEQCPEKTNNICTSNYLDYGCLKYNSLCKETESGCQYDPPLNEVPYNDCGINNDLRDTNSYRFK